MWVSQLAGPDRNHGVEMTTAYPSDNTSKHHPRDVLRRSLQCASEYRPYTANLNGLQSTNLVRIYTNTDGSYQVSATAIKQTYVLTYR